ncbi:ribonucleotide reductase of class iii (anaerobic), large subunit [hydrocarbon metagenome]|uniref:Ribonucleotide reductase of class iii (Anaerobic), large subunit n=1 Tax=hydrocarbon metagenome TaxID=938273 RepID=A0A0W8FM35_9ZZZZ
MADNPETTDLTLFVRTSAEEVAPWNRQRIIDALVREADIDYPLADEISREVEKQIISAGIGVTTTALVREMVNVRLIERGLEKERRLHGRLGFPLYDVRRLILHQNKQDANIPHSPEGTNLIFAEGIKRELSLYDVFAAGIGEAHVTGDIHIHALGYIDRPYSCCQSLEYLKINGLKLPHAINSANPAKYAEVLLAHMVRFSAVLQGHFAGTIGWDAVNISFAPYLTSMTDREIKQFAQMLVYEFSQLSATRGGQALYTDIHVYYEMPPYWAKLPAIGAEGKPTGKNYGDYTRDAQRFARAIMEVFEKGDAKGKPFILPRPLLHITENIWKEKDAQEFLLYACDVAGQKGNTCFVFDREKNAPIAAFNDEELAKPWLQRLAAIQTVTLNLPRLGYKAEGDEEKLLALLTEFIEKAAKAHVQKRDFLEKLLSYAEDGPLAVLAMNHDGFPFLRMKKASYVIGIAGLNELTQIHTGNELHQSNDALEFGLKVVNYIKREADRLSKELKMNIVLGQSLAETTAYRFARLDLRYYSPAAGRYVKGNIAEGAVYYTNPTQLNVAADIASLQRVIREGLFHKYLEGDVFTHIQLGGSNPGKEKLSEFIRSVFYYSLNRQIDFNPEFTFCLTCEKTARGLHEKCVLCGSSDVEGIARLTKYFSKTSGWNKGKLAELKNRKINDNFDK